MADNRTKTHTIHELNLLITKALQYLFYRKLYKGYKDLLPIKNLHDYAKLPMISRNDFFHFSSHIFSSYDMKSRANALGLEPFVPITKHEYQQMVTNEWERFKQAGVTQHDRISVVDFTLNHATPIAQSIVEHNHTYVVVEGTDEEMCSTIIHKNVSVIFTHIRMVNKLVEYAKTHAIKQWPLRLIITGGETIPNLRGTQREVKNILDTTLVDSIGTRQLCTYAITDQKDNRYHFLYSSVYPEIVPFNSQKSYGEIVITPFWKNEFPLLRFRTGDVIATSIDSSFKRVSYRIGDEYKIGSNMLNLQTVYHGIQQSIYYQYFFDRILWKFIRKPQYKLILTTYNHRDVLLLLIEKEIFSYSLRQKRDISNRCEQLSGTGCEVIPITKEVFKRLLLPKGYMDIRYAPARAIPKTLQIILNTVIL